MILSFLSRYTLFAFYGRICTSKLAQLNDTDKVKLFILKCKRVS